MNEHWLIVIPARLASSRLPEKPLQDLNGRPLIVRVYENLKPLLATGVKIVIACDAKKVASVCEKYQLPWVMTSKQHESGTDRVFEVALKHKPIYVLNVQGDEPFANLEDLRRLTESLEQEKAIGIATLYYKSTDISRFFDANLVKVVKSASNRAIYFSRSPIPFGRDQSISHFYQHLGVYAYKSEVLAKFCSLKKSSLEELEKLEQLRALENDIPIKLVEAKNPSFGIDTPEDLDKARLIK